MIDVPIGCFILNNYCASMWYWLKVLNLSRLTYLHSVTMTNVDDSC